MFEEEITPHKARIREFMGEQTERARQADCNLTIP